MRLASHLFHFQVNNNEKPCLSPMILITLLKFTHKLFCGLGPGTVVVASGLSILSTEFPAAQRVLDKGKKNIRDFAEHDKENSMEDDLGLGFEIVDDPKAEKKVKNKGMERLRAITKDKILPLVDSLNEKDQKDSAVEEKKQKVTINSDYDMYNMLSR